MFGWKRRGRGDATTKIEAAVPSSPAPAAGDEPKDALLAEDQADDVWRYRGGPLTFRRLGGKTQEVFPVDQSVLLGNSTASVPFLIHQLRVLPDLDLAGEEGVSRRHAQVVVRGGECRILDLNSEQGTYVNGERVPPGAERLLLPADEIRLGGEVRFYFLATTLDADKSVEDQFLSRLIDDALHLEPGTEAAPLESPLSLPTAVWEDMPVFVPADSGPVAV
jgi:hypothetical protein